MKNAAWVSRIRNEQPSPDSICRIAMGTAIALLLLISGAVFGQSAAQPAAAPGAQMSVPSGFSVHEAVDLGGRFNDIVGSGPMYDSLLNTHTGPRVFGETFEMHALPGRKSAPLDDLRAFGSGFGGDPFSIARLDFSKSKYYEFSALFRRDRKYFDYDLLGNPNIPGGQTMPIGPSNAPTGSFLWPQTMQSPFLFNTVRRMTDTNLTVAPLSVLTLHIAYSKNMMEGPSLSPSGYSFAKYNAILSEYQRNDTDDFTGSLDWKPVQGTKFTYEQQFTHYKGDSYFTLNPNALIVQEADGTRVAINDYDSLSPYGIGACNTGSMGSAYSAGPPAVYTIFTAPTGGGVRVINPACAVVSSYLRTAPTRVLFPTEVFRMQSTTFRNISMNGNVRFTDAHMHLPNYFDSYQGLNGATRSASYFGNAIGKREVLAADYGIDWQISNRFGLAEQADFSNMHQPGTTSMTSGVVLSTPTNPNETINYQGALTQTNSAAGSSPITGNAAIGTPGAGFTGQLYVTNYLTASWEASSRFSLSFTYRYQNHVVAEGNPHNIPLPVGATIGGTVTINENAGILTAAFRPAANWDVSGSVEVSYADNALTPVSPRQLRHYRVHSVYKPRPWATISGAYNDLERHNNTNNNASAVAAGDDPYEGPLDHVDYSRIASVTASLMPSEHFGLDMSYIYTDIYSATNECFDNGNQGSTVGAYPGTATLTASGAPNVCPGIWAGHPATVGVYADWFGRDFMTAPTQFGSATVTFSPVDKVHYGLGYRMSEVNGNQFFNDARLVNGSLDSSYQSPYASFAFKARPDLTLKGEYDFFGYGEFGHDGPQYCSFSTSTTSSVVPCSSLTAQTALNISKAGETAPRSFHANNIMLGVHYEF
jgi:hypothetical protein